MMEPTHIGQFRLSSSGELIWADAPTARIIGLDEPGRVLGASTLAAIVKARARPGSAEGAPAPFSFEHAWQGPGGEPRGARVTLLPRLAVGGEIDHFDGVIEEARPGASGVDAPSMGLLESILEGLPNPVFVKDTLHRWVLLNAAFCQFMGRDRAELLGKSDFAFFPAAEAQVFWAKDDEVFAAGGINENEEQFTDSSGRTHVIITRKTLHADEQGRRFLVGVITDITALREASEQLRASRDALEDRVQERTTALTEANALLREQDANRTAFLTMLGHEIRNPLAAILTSTHLMERAPPDSPVARRARDVVKRQAKVLTRLCDDLLDVSRMAHGKLELQRERVNLAEIVRTICQDQRAQFDEQMLVLAFEAEDDPIWVEVDVTRLTQVVDNLLHNARKFTPPAGRVQVTVRRTQGTAEIVVRDTGIGMAAQDLKRVFEPLVQVSSAQSRSHGGLGLGLALVKGLAEAHGGAATVRSQGPGRGVEFAVSLPLAPRPEAIPLPERPVASLRPLEIVLIEDKPDMRDMLAETLRLEGCEVQTAQDGRSGLNLVKVVRPDVVICDLGLPDIDGFGVARELRSDPAFASCRLIALSGFVQPEDVRRSKEAGFDAHLPKPLRLDDLRLLLSEAARP
jgi:two-component system CheB/CheR fusion protein